MYPQRGCQTKPPASTAVVIIDVINNQGAIRVYEVTGGKYLSGVGTEYAGSMVIVPWNDGWDYYASGTVRVGYVAK